MKKPDSLQVVLSLRTRTQDAAERALADALRDMQAAQQLLTALRDEHSRLRNQPVALCGELLHLPDLLHRAQQVQALEHSCNQALTVLNEHKETTAQRQATYLHARRECEVVDALLKQRAMQARALQSRVDAKRSDDLYLGRFHHRDDAGSLAV